MQITIEPGPVEPGGLSQDERLAVIEECERAQAQLDAIQLRHIQAMVADPEPRHFSHDQRRVGVLLEIKTALHWSEYLTVQKIDVAEALAAEFSSTLALLDRGRISYANANALVELTRRLDPDVARQVEERMLTKPRQSQADFRKSAKRIIARLDPRGEQERHDAADQDRRVTVRPGDHAMANLDAYLSADDAQTVMTAVQAVADRMKADAPIGDVRTADQWRADGLVAMCSWVLCGHATDDSQVTTDCRATDDAGRVPGWDGYLPRWQGRRPSIQVTVALSTLLGIDDQPGELGGYGAIPAELARRIAADPTGTWRRLVTDPTGRLTDYGRTVYKPPADLRDHVIARDRTSRFPGDHRTARRCDLDHRIRWVDGGPTNADNLQALSPRAHTAKDELGWSVRMDSTGALHWISRIGRSYDVDPQTYPTDITIEPHRRVSSPDQDGEPRL